MKVNLDCIPCFQKQVLKAIGMNTKDEKIQEKVLRKVMLYLMKADWTVTPPELADEVHRIVRKETRIEDPYGKAKKNCNELALKLLPEIRDKVNESPEPLETAARIAIAGNIMDFGPTGGNFDIEKVIGEVLGKTPAINDYQLFKERLKHAKTLLFFADNAGEIAFDKLLIENMLEFRKKIGIGDLKITLVVKGGPIINDAMLKDAEYVGMDKIPLIEFKTISNGDPGTGPARNSGEVEAWIRGHDIIVAKGQGNYEGLSQFEGIFFLLIAKCNVIAYDLGVKQGDIVLKYAKG